MDPELNNTPDEPSEDLADGMSMDDALGEVEKGLGLDSEPTEEGQEGETTTTESAASVKAPAAPDKATTAPADSTQLPDRFNKPPEGWQQLAASWDTLTPDVKQAVWAREEAVREHLGKVQEHVDVSAGVEKLFAPYAQLFADYQVNPWDHVATLLNAHATLMFGRPEQKAAIINKLITDTGLDRQKLAAGDAAPYNADQQALRQEVQNLRQQLMGVTSQVSEGRLQEMEEQITAFASKPENVYFWRVVPEMQRLLTQNPRMTLEAAYQDAVMLNPITRAEEVDRLARERAEKAAQANAKRTAEARKATAVNVKSRESGAMARGDSWEDTIKDTLAEIRARQ